MRACEETAGQNFFQSSVHKAGSPKERKKFREKERKKAARKNAHGQKIKFRFAAEILSSPQKIQNDIVMQKNLRAVMALLAKSRREIEIHSVDFDYTGLSLLADEMRKADRVMTLVVGDNLTQDMVETLVSISGDRFNLKFL